MSLEIPYWVKTERYTQESLSRHIVGAHIANPRVLCASGLQYDAELVAHLGFSLDREAVMLSDILLDIQEGRPWATPLDELRHHCPDAASLNRFMSTGEGREYEGVVAHELLRIIDLGVVTQGFTVDSGRLGEIARSPRREDPLYW